jgi:NitT/TauT family transport system substrate-binding protein
VRDYNDAFIKNKDRDAIVQIMAKYALVKDPALYAQMRILAVNPDGRVGAASLISDQEWFASNGCVRKSSDLRSAIDNSFADAAVAALGKY